MQEFYYTSIDCSCCGVEVKKALSTRTHRCLSCGLVLDRDENAARNILAKANFKGIYRTLVREVKQPKEGEMPSMQAEATQVAPEDKNSSQSLIIHPVSTNKRERKTKVSTSAQPTSESYTQLELWDIAPETG